MGQESLSGYGRHVRAADLDVDDRALFAYMAESTRNFIRKNGESRPHFAFGHQITGESKGAEAPQLSLFGCLQLYTEVIF